MFRWLRQVIGKQVRRWSTVVSTKRRECVCSLQNESFYSVLQYWTQKYLTKTSCPCSNTGSFMRKLPSLLNQVNFFGWFKGVISAAILLILWDFSTMSSVFELHLSHILQESSIPLLSVPFRHTLVLQALVIPMLWRWFRHSLSSYWICPKGKHLRRLFWGCTFTTDLTI